MNRNYIISLIILALIFFKCDPGVDVQKSPIDNLYSINCFISPQDTLFQCYIYRALRLGSVANTDDALVPDAAVILTDGYAADTLVFNDDNKRYEGLKKHLVIEALKTYYLKVYLPSGQEIVASCIVPPTPDSPHVSGMRSKDNYLFDVNWANPADHKYFVVAANAIGTYLGDSRWGQVLTQLSAQLEDNFFPSDQQKTINSEGGSVRYAFRADDPQLKISLFNLDANMYKYYDTYWQYDNWIINSSDGVPNFREPKAIFSNVENAVGIFGAFNKTSVTIHITE